MFANVANQHYEKGFVVPWYFFNFHKTGKKSIKRLLLFFFWLFFENIENVLTFIQKNIIILRYLFKKWCHFWGIFWKSDVILINDVICFT